MCDGGAAFSSKDYGVGKGDLCDTCHGLEGEDGEVDEWRWMGCSAVWSSVAMVGASGGMMMSGCTWKGDDNTLDPSHRPSDYRARRSIVERPDLRGL